MRLSSLLVALAVVLVCGEVASAQCGSGVGFRGRRAAAASACGSAAPTVVYHLPAAPVVVQAAPAAAPKLSVTVAGGPCANGACASGGTGRTVIRIRQR